MDHEKTPKHAAEIPESENVRIEGTEVLAQVAQWNREGKHVIFAPNHLEPSGRFASLRAQSALADDYPALRRVLEKQGISATPIMRGDMNLGVSSRLGRMTYGLHRKLFSVLGRAVSGGIPIGINIEDHKGMASTNVGAAREMIRTLQEKSNLVLYPHGNWFPSGAQAFDPMEDLEQGSAFISKDDFARWRAGLKKGFVSLARQADVPIVPVYVEHEGDRWTFRFGSPIAAPAPGEAAGKRDVEVRMAQEYLAAMRRLKDGGTGKKG